MSRSERITKLDWELPIVITWEPREDASALIHDVKIGSISVYSELPQNELDMLEEALADLLAGEREE